jgi:hypothetical protein
MQNRSFRWLRRMAAALLAAALPALAALPIVPGEPVQAPKAQAAPELRIEARVEAHPALRASARLAPVQARELALVRRANAGSRLAGKPKRVVIGVVRAQDATPRLPSAAELAWLPVEGGHAAQMAVASPDAQALRVSLDLAGVPGNVEMVFFGSGDPAHLVGPVRVADIPDRTSPWWSPVTEGETQTVEVFVPEGVDAPSLPMRAVAVSHLFSGPSSRFEKTSQDIGSAGSCNVDVACSASGGDAAFRNASASVAQMVFNDGSLVGLCTGTLLNDADKSTQVPWFLSANHCFDNEQAPYKTPGQMQQVAGTLDTLWFFEASTCGGSALGASYRELPSGATYIFNDATSDVLFVRLNGTPPASAYFAGWDANPVPVGTAVTDFHHPQGDLKKVSQGSVLGFTTPTVPPASSGVNRYIGVQWSSGTTEAGSSGSAIFTPSASGYVVRGALWGGAASCSNRVGMDLFSRFDQAYPALAKYLSPANAPFADFTDLWWNPAESGWGLNITQHASHVIFAVWYTYDTSGKRTWYFMPSGTWTSSSTYTGPLYSASGSAFDAPFQGFAPTQVGTGTLRFTDASNGTWSYTVNGASGSEPITRQPF